jgi:hypothetical protein
MKKYNIVSMINLDMIGRLTDNKLSIGGTGTSSIWQGCLIHSIKPTIFQRHTAKMVTGQVTMQAFMQRIFRIVHVHGTA